MLWANRSEKVSVTLMQTFKERGIWQHMHYMHGLT